MKEWRPIALCNVLYKLVAKVMANRLKSVLHKCISDNHAAFVLGRSILDNAMISIEVIHHMKIRKCMRDMNVTLKLYIIKAYDRIDWLFLKEVTIKMGFTSRWICWIMMCVETVDYPVIVNNESAGPIFPSTGTQTGCPCFSLFFYLVCILAFSFYPQS